MTAVYLCGGINGLSDEEAKSWRDTAAGRLTAAGFAVFDPMVRDYRGRESVNVNTIVTGDLADIDASDVLLVRADRPSWGTAMEVFYAYSAKKRVVAFGVDPAKCSPWLSYHTHSLHPTLDEAITALCGG